MGNRAASIVLPMPRGGGPELNDYAQEVKVILETAFAEIGGAATPLTAATGLLAANNLSDLISAATARINLGLAIGANVEAWSANLDLLAALSSAAATNLTVLGALSSAAANAGQVPMIANAGGWSLGSPLMDDRIINGAMRIDQRHVGAAITPGAGSAYTVDRWAGNVAQASKLTFQQVSSTAPGFTAMLRVTVASAYTPVATDQFALFQPIEGNNVADFAWGTASAKTVTLSFWARASVAGTYAASLRQGSGTRSYVATFALLANTDTYVTATIPGDTSGTWSTDTNVGIYVAFDLGSGTNFNTTAGAWQAGNFTRTSGCVSLVANAAATLRITGVRLQPGSIATPYVLRPHSLELMLCQRYYQKSYDENAAPGSVTGSTVGTILGSSDSTSVLRLWSNTPVRMRTTPTATTYSYATGASGVVRNDTLGVDVATGSVFGAQTIVGVIATLAGAGHQAQFHWTLDGEL